MSGGPDILLATCEAFPKGDPDTEALATYLKKSGTRTRVVAWSDASVLWEASRATVIRSAWDYHEHLDDFLEWAGTVPRLWNPLNLIRWNTDKAYLMALAHRWPTLPAEILESPTGETILQTIRTRGWREAVVKPCVGLDGHGVERVAVQDTASLAPPRQGRWLVQPLAPDVRTNGEVSVVVIDGEPAHAVRRRPAAGEFRTQERLGGSVASVKLDPEWAAFARSLVSTLDPLPLYARVDLIEYEGRFCLLELELVEPSLFLSHNPPTLDLFARALERRVG